MPERATVIYLQPQAGKPQHVHHCVEGDQVHQWPCASPYCSSIERLCVEHGGHPPRTDE